MIKTWTLVLFSFLIANECQILKTDSYYSVNRIIKTLRGIIEPTTFKFIIDLGYNNLQFFDYDSKDSLTRHMRNYFLNILFTHFRIFKAYSRFFKPRMVHINGDRPRYEVEEEIRNLTQTTLQGMF